MSSVKVGDVVAWDKVPDGSLVRWVDGSLVVRIEGLAALAFTCGDWRWQPGKVRRRGVGLDDIGTIPSTIAALNLTGHETAADLQRLAEVYEVLEAYCKVRGTTLQAVNADDADGFAAAGAMSAAMRLRASGWRPGMTAEVAADLLAMPFTCCTCGKPITNSAELAACRGAGPVRRGAEPLAEVRDG